MKKRIVFNSVLLISLLTIGSINANALTIKPQCPTSATVGSNITVTAVATRTSSDPKVSAVEGVLSYDGNNLDLSSSSNASGWTGLSAPPKFAVGDLTFSNLMSTTSKNIYKFNFKVKSNASGTATVKIDSTKATDDTGSKLSSVSGGSCNIKILSSINTLSSLTVSGIDFNFTSGTNTYNLNTNNSSVTISGTKTDSKSTVTGFGTKTLKYGKNTFKVVVKSESGVSRTYTLNITRNDTRSKTNTLSSLSLSEGNIAFSPTKTSYTVNVKANTSSVTISATKTDSKSTFVSGYGPRTISLVSGNNVAYIKVKAENGATKTYTLSINVEDGRSKNANLKSITIPGYNLNFNKYETKYKISVPYETEKLEISALPEDNKARVKIEDKNLEVGKNAIAITVIAENRSAKIYILEVERLEKEVVLSTNNNLKALTVEGYDLEFNKNISEYNLTVEDTNDLNVIAVPEDSKAKVTIVGNTNIKDGSKINIAVSAENGSVKEYDIIIKVKEKSTFIYFIIGAVAAAIIAIVTLIIIKTKNKTDETKIISATNLSSNQKIQ